MGNVAGRRNNVGKAIVAGRANVVRASNVVAIEAILK